MKNNPFLNKYYKNSSLHNREIDLILCHVLDINTAGLFIYNKTISADEDYLINDLCNKRSQGLPFAYITGKKSFWTLDLKVNQHTLIPRPETEMLVELVLQKTDANFKGRVLDLGTGTGAIALSIATERPFAKISAIDFSYECIKVAKFNKKQHSIKNVQVFQSDWFDNVGQDKFDIIVSNPPYIDENDAHLINLKYEPDTALTAKKNGFADLIHIIENAKKHLQKNGIIMLEHGYNQHTRVQQYLSQNNYKNVKTHNDLAGIPRITTAEF